MSKELSKMHDDNERMAEALADIAQWANAYPVTVFCEPDLKLAGEVLQAAGISLDSLHATWARQLLKGVRQIARRGLGL